MSAGRATVTPASWWRRVRARIVWETETSTALRRLDTLTTTVTWALRHVETRAQPDDSVDDAAVTALSDGLDFFTAESARIRRVRVNVRAGVVIGWAVAFWIVLIPSWISDTPTGPGPLGEILSRGVGAVLVALGVVLLWWWLIGLDDRAALRGTRRRLASLDQALRAMPDAAVLLAVQREVDGCTTITGELHGQVRRLSAARGPSGGPPWWLAMSANLDPRHVAVGHAAEPAQADPDARTRDAR